MTRNRKCRVRITMMYLISFEIDSQSNLLLPRDLSGCNETIDDVGKFPTRKWKRFNTELISFEIDSQSNLLLPRDLSGCNETIDDVGKFPTRKWKRFNTEFSRFERWLVREINKFHTNIFIETQLNFRFQYRAT